MALCFLIILCAFLSISYFLLKNINNEISHLVAVFAAISLILGLIFSPWQFLFLLLIVVLISTSYDYYTSKAVISQEPEDIQQPVLESEADHSLIYRGACYHAEPNIKLDEVTIQPVTYKLSFRGGSYLVRVDPKVQSTGVTTPPVTYKLSFRGGTYSINKTAHRQMKAQDG